MVRGDYYIMKEEESVDDIISTVFEKALDFITLPNGETVKINEDDSFTIGEFRYVEVQEDQAKVEFSQTFYIFKHKVGDSPPDRVFGSASGATFTQGDYVDYFVYTVYG